MTGEMKSKKAPAARFNDAKFVNYALTPEEKLACKSWLLEMGQLDDALLKACEAGYAFSVKFDSFNGAYQATMRYAGDKTVNQNLLLVGRGSSPVKAYKQALFLHYMIFDEDWAPYAERSKLEEFDD